MSVLGITGRGGLRGCRCIGGGGWRDTRVEYIWARHSLDHDTDRDKVSGGRAEARKCAQS
jgi:hypothetical protein